MGVLAACIGTAPFGVLNIGWIAELTSAGTAIALTSTLGLVLIAFVTGVGQVSGARHCFN